ncbi:MAG: cutinase [Actinobacteria bacterium]|nr:cutinase [Actinomycetota bacterium]
MINRSVVWFVVGLLLGYLVGAYVDIPEAHGDDCVGSWSMVVGGFQAGLGYDLLPSAAQDSWYMTGNQRVGYNSIDPVSGINEVDRLYWQHRDSCPGDHIKLVGHSMGAAIVHAWVTAHPDAVDTNAVLLADPKRVAGPGDSGLSGDPLAGVLGYPLAGVDDQFGNVPVLTVCNGGSLDVFRNDQICDKSSGWAGYFAGAHQRYDMNAFNYGDWDSGVVYSQ